MGIVDDYKNLVKKFNTGETIKAYLPIPTEKDYEKGYINRFFVQKTNDKNYPIYEINQKSYTRLSLIPDYVTVSIRWRLTGPLETVYDDLGNILDFGVRESNKRVILLKKDTS